MVTQMCFTGRWLDSQRRCNQKIVGTVHAALRWGLLILLNCHDNSCFLKILKFNISNPQNRERLDIPAAFVRGFYYLLPHLSHTESHSCENQRNKFTAIPYYIFCKIFCILQLLLLQILQHREWRFFFAAFQPFQRRLVRANRMLGRQRQGQQSLILNQFNDIQ
jgi:hypothetical protein